MTARLQAILLYVNSYVTSDSTRLLKACKALKKIDGVKACTLQCSC